jgi:hypothetical protein
MILSTTQVFSKTTAVALNFNPVIKCDLYHIFDSLMLKMYNVTVSFPLPSFSFLFLTFLSFA